MIDSRSRAGAAFALAAFSFWGVVPIYFKSVSAVSAWEILAHRVVWSVVLLFCLLALTGQFRTLRLSGARAYLTLVITSILLVINWLIFIVAIIEDNITETALGYYINPLVSVFLGMVFLGERLRPLQWLAIVIAASGILVQLVYYDRVPWYALGLALSFGSYGLFRKNLRLPPMAGLFLESAMIAPFALGALTWWAWRGELFFGTGDVAISSLLIAGGFVTSFPLLCFAAAVNRLSLTAVGVFQYIAPSVSLILAIVIYNEPFGTARAITFTCIWTALTIFTWEAWRHHSNLDATLPDKKESLINNSL